MPKLILVLALALSRNSYTQTLDSFAPSLDGSISALAEQTDGKIVLAGWFKNVAGYQRETLARLHPDGSLDISFRATVNNGVNCLAIQADGKIIVGGSLTEAGGQQRLHLARFYPGGALDGLFQPLLKTNVQVLAIQPDGKILAGGGDDRPGGPFLVRLNPDGSTDTSFHPTLWKAPRLIQLQPDGMILVADPTSITRFYTDGSQDLTFNPTADRTISAMAVQVDGKILVGGQFLSLSGMPRKYFGRFNTDGTFDGSFTPEVNASVSSIVVQSDGKIVIGRQIYLGRFLPDGTLETTFVADCGSAVLGIALQSTGQVLLTGDFYSVLGKYRRYLARLNQPEPSAQSLAVDGTTIRWLRSGPGPEVSAVTFSASTNGHSWAVLGPGERSSSGFLLHLDEVVSNATIRASGYTATGRSTWVVGSSVGPPAFINQDASRTIAFGATTNFHVIAAGSAPMTFHWLKNGSPISDGGNIFGASTSSLIISNAVELDAGNYSIIVSNSFGSITSQVAVLTVIPLITRQPSNVQTNGGATAVFSVTAAGTDLQYQWQKAGADIAGATTPSLTLTNVQRVDAGSYAVVVSNVFGAVTSTAATLTVNLAALNSFNPGADLSVYGLGVQRDGKLLVAGRFNSLCGQGRTYLGRLNVDGTLDSSFNPVPNSVVNCVAIQDNGRILVGGEFTQLYGQPRKCIARLESDGALEARFDPGAGGSVYALLAQPDGKILVGGIFTNLAGQSCSRLGRLERDGALDSTFDAGTNGTVFSLALQTDGKILVAGPFVTLGGRLQKFLGRLHPNGTLDDSFLPVITGQQVACAVVQPNGQILIGGDFTAVNGQARNSLARLNADGSLDPTFQAGTNPPVTSLMLQADGRILVGTMFTSLSGRTVNGFGRLNQDGSVDGPFKVSASGNVLCLAGDDAGTIFAGGDFTSVNGQTRNRIAEVANLEPARRELSFDGAALTWHRSGTALELRSPCFYISTNAADWARLPEAERVADGWRIPGSDFWANCYFRAEGFVSAGRYNGSEWRLDTVTGPLLILTQPVSQSVAAGQNVLLSVVASGLLPITYQWRKDGSPLQDATNASLSLKNVQWTNIGGYDVVVMNGAAAMTSAVANLTVMIPAVVDSWRPSSGNVNPMLVQPDGKVVVGYSKSVVRFNVDGTVDEGFHPPELAMVGGYGKAAWCFALQEDGKLIVGGSFTNQSGPPRAYLQRLHPDGTLDLSFNPEPNTIVASVAIEPDGKVVVGGYFTQMSGVERNRIARLNPDGTLDEGFNPAADGYVDALALTSNGRILVGGYFTSLSGQRRISLGRLAPDGSLDQGFAAEVGGKVYCLAVQHDGKILVSGQFSILCNQNRANIGRLEPDGTLDPGFNPGANNDVGALAVQADGKIVVAGWFTSLGNQGRKYLARLHADGSLDQTFDPAPNNSVYSTVLQPDGKLLVGGYFTAMGGVTVRGLARLTTSYPATQDLSFDGSTVLWKRGGTGPELSFATFQYWSTGAGWTSLGVGEPIAAGWRVAAPNVPPNASLRARGFVTSDDSSWWFETSTGTPPEPVLRIVVDDSWFGFRSNQFGFNVSGSAGEQVVFEASTNLTDWSAVSTNTVGSGAPHFTEPDVALPSRFFRVRTQR